MTVQEAREKAESNFKSGLNCAQSVVKVFAQELGFDENMMVSVAVPFGGGTCRMRETCGAFSGMMLCLGMKLGVSDGDKDRKDLIYGVGQELAERFKKKNGSIICRELLGLVPLGTSDSLTAQKKSDSHQADKPVSEERTQEYYKKRPCAQLCADAAEIFAQWLNDLR